MASNKPKTSGVHHIGLTFSDINAARSFFIEALGFKQVGEVPSYPAFFVSDGSIMLTLWQAENPEATTPFDRKNNIGLHHFALQVNDLNEVAETLASRDDVSIEFAPEGLGDTTIRHMMVRIPGNIRMELIQP